MNRMRRGYDRLAGCYAGLERVRFGTALHRARVALLPELVQRLVPAEPSTVLDRAPDAGHILAGTLQATQATQRAPSVLFLGDGDGRLLAEFAAACPTASITSLDISPQMLRRQRQRLERTAPAPAVNWQCIEVESIEFPAAHFDAVVTAFFLDCFDRHQLDELLPRIANWLREGGYWYVVDFQLPTGQLRRRWAALWLAVMHAFFRWHTGMRSRKLVAVEPLLVSLGFDGIVERQMRGGLLYAKIYQRPTVVGCDVPAAREFDTTPGDQSRIA